MEKLVILNNLDIWNQVANPKGSKLRNFQETFQKYFSFAPPLFHGRGVLQYTWGLMPHRRNIVAVVGRPIQCPKIAEPSEEIIKEYQQKYFDSMMETWEEYKDVYAPNRTGELKFTE